MTNASITPPRINLLREMFAGVDAIGMPGALLRAWGQGDVEKKKIPVIVLPGFGANDASTLPLRAFLRGHGYHAEGWGLGLNQGGRGMIKELDELSDRWDVDRARPHSGEGEVPALCDRFFERLADRIEDFGSPVSLIGWSLGGVVAREAAREFPKDVVSVVTLGSPARGGPKHTTIAPLFRARNVDLDWIEEAVEARFETPIHQPITAIYSKDDGIVSEFAAIDPHSPNIRHLEVATSHLGMGVNPNVWNIVLDALTDTHAKM